MRTVILCLLLIVSFPLFAQRTCATSEYTLEQYRIDPALATKAAALEAFIANRELPTSASTTSSATSGVQPIIRIPVVIHVLYNNAAQNISDAQIKSGLDALNRDFRRKNGDTTNTPARFRNLAADIEIEFVLATADPKGRATTGIIRKQTSVSEWRMDDKIKFSNQGGDDAWDSDSYLNIWIGNMRSLLGYSSAPGAAKDKDGVVIASNAFGTLNMSGPYNMGRTVVHEVGHWMGLKHIWGDTYCGDDGVGDTPTQGNFTSGCPSGFRSSCSNGSLGDMYMNYMDFTDDACMNLFTEGQKTRMRTLFNNGGPRAALLQSKGLWQPWLEEIPVKEDEAPKVEEKVVIYPNPVRNQLTIDLATNDSWIGKALRIISINGVAVKTIIVTGKMQKVDVSALAPGIYFIQGATAEASINQKIIKH